MQLYRTTYEDEGNGPRHTWQGTQADARAERKRLADEGKTDIVTKDVDVPTNKPGLLAWLNSNVTGE